MEEAEEMKQSCIAMLKEIHYDFMVDYIEIAEINLNNACADSTKH